MSPPLAVAAPPSAPGAEQRRVVIRLLDGETILVGMTPMLERASSVARAWIARLNVPDGEWPQIGDRFVRPEAIVSVDVLRWS
ncbi:MAG: hypothetical protein H0T13_01270 [Actinobacteria bacterium]|nr:hypothetical protein [Actinomycetota bacterium]